MIFEISFFVMIVGFAMLIIVTRELCSLNERTDNIFHVVAGILAFGGILGMILSL